MHVMEFSDYIVRLKHCLATKKKGAPQCVGHPSLVYGSVYPILTCCNNYSKGISGC